MSEVKDFSNRMILKIGGVHHKQLSALHALLDNEYHEQVSGKHREYSIPILLSVKSDHGFGTYLIELEIPLGSGRDRPGRIMDDIFNALNILKRE